MPCEDTDGVSVVDEYPLHAVAKLLGIEDEVQLTEALISNVNHIKGKNNMSRGMKIPTMWHSDMCMLRRACAASFKLRNSK